MSMMKRLLSAAMSMVIGAGVFSIAPNLELNVYALTAEDYTVSQNGIDFICTREGFTAQCFLDGDRSYIGYGTLCGCQGHANGTHTVTMDEAKAMMMNAIEKNIAPNVKRQTKGIQMTQNQYDALISFTYNTGGGTSMIYDSPLVQYLLGNMTQEEATKAYAEYAVYSAGAGMVLQGLKNRRIAEAELFFGQSAAVLTDEALNIPYLRPVAGTALRKGTKGTGVKWLQTALNRLMQAGLSVDGDFGKATETAVLNFQKAYNLETDGVAGPLTLATLIAVLSAQQINQESASQEYAMVNTTDAPLNMREKASTSSNIIGHLPKGATVQVIRRENNDWWYCYNENVGSGYLAARYLAVLADTTQEQTAVTTTVTTTTVVTEAPKDMAGDVNCDGSVNMIDALMLMQYINENSGVLMTEQGLMNAECDGTEGLTTEDVSVMLEIISMKN